MTFRLADGVAPRESGAGRFLLADRPLRAVRVNEALFRLVSAGGPAKAGTPAEARALEALARAGYLEAEREDLEGERPWPAVSVVIPVKDRADELRRCLLSLSRLRYPAERLEVIVVDDGSSDGSPEAARALGARVVPSGGRGRGPASARNRGAQEARGDLLAFLDSDCTASPGWLRELVAAFDAPEVAAVGGRVEGMHCATALDRYEATMSSLCLGRRELAGRGGDDTFYLPSCNLLVRRSAFLEAGGFREGMHVGEDVDLTWRLRDRGFRIAYLPRGWVYHEHRNRFGAFLRRRFEYGTSEASLQELHPRRRKKLAAPPGLAAALALAALAAAGGGMRWLAAAAAVLGVDALWSRRRFAGRGIHVGVGQALRARARAAASLAYYLGYHGLRYYAWLLLPLAALAPRGGAVLAGVWLAVAAVDRRTKRSTLALPAFLLYYFGEQLAYGAGVFWGCLQRGTFRSYRPALHRRMAMSLT